MSSIYVTHEIVVYKNTWIVYDFYYDSVSCRRSNRIIKKLSYYFWLLENPNYAYWLGVHEREENEGWLWQTSGLYMRGMFILVSCTNIGLNRSTSPKPFPETIENIRKSI